MRGGFVRWLSTDAACVRRCLALIVVMSTYLASSLLHQIVCIHLVTEPTATVVSTQSVAGSSDALAVSVCDRCPLCSSAVVPTALEGGPSFGSEQACFAGSSLVIALRASPDTPPPKLPA